MVRKTLKQYPRLRCALAAAGAVLALLPFTLHADTVDLSTLPEDLRDLTAEESANIPAAAARYAELAQRHRKGG